MVAAPVLVGHGLLIGLADRVLHRQAAVVLGALFGSHLWQRGRDGRRHEVEILRGERFFPLPEGHGDGLVLIETDLLDADVAVLRCPDNHVAMAGGERGAALGIGLLRGHGVELGVIVEFKLHTGVADGLAQGIVHHDSDLRRGGIVVDDVDLGVAGRAAHHLLRTVVVAEDLRVHQHAARSTLVEPSQVQDRLRLAGPEEVPLSVGPGLHPGVVVVGVGPAGRIDLAGGDAHAPEGRHEQRRLLAAASIGRADGGQGRAGARVGGPIRDVLMTPVVDL